MTLTKWHKAHQGRTQGSMYIGVALGVLARGLVGGNVLVQFLVAVTVGVAATWAFPIVFWFFASDGRRAQR